MAREAGIRFRHVNGARGRKFMPETVNGGLAFLDYNNDGWQDLLFVNGTSWPGDPPLAETPHLYRNEGGGRFTDVTREAGLTQVVYGMGAAVADYDNDGWPDVYITCIGPNLLLRNTLGDPGRKGPVFRNVAREAGVEGVPVDAPGIGLRWKWSTSAAWLDYDKDGRLDLFVCHYVKWSPHHDVWCGRPGGPKAYCPPGSYEGYPSALYHNEGGGRFRDVSAETGVRRRGLEGKSLGVAVADFNGDSWPDIAVANDTWANFLFLNQQGRRFEESAVEAGIAVGEDGATRAGMGIDAGDWKNNGRFGLVIGNFSGESLSLHENDGQAFFTDQAQAAGLAAPSLTFLTFGACWFDYNLDGWQDLVTANGHIDDFVRSYDTMVSYEERPLLFRNRRDGTFEEVAEKCGESMKVPVVGRGLAVADMDNDGDLDFAMVSNGRAALLNRNDGGNANRWIRFRTEGVLSNREGIGALIRVTVGGITQSQYVHSGGSFLAESQRQPTFGLGRSDRAESVEVAWPSGAVDRTGPLEAGRQYLIREGKGFAADSRGPSSGGLRR